MAERKKGLLSRLGLGKTKADAPVADAPPRDAPVTDAPVPDAPPRALTPAERALQEARALAREREARGIDAVEDARLRAEAVQAERLKAERLEAESLEAEARLKAEAEEKAQKAAEHQAARQAAEKAAERKAAQEAERLEREAAKREAEETARKAAERAEKERAEKEKAAKAKAVADKAAREKEKAAKADAARAETAAEAAVATPASLASPDGNIFQRMSRGLRRSTAKLSENVAGAFSKRLLDEAALEDLEDMLIASDLGVKPSLEVVRRLEDQRFNTTVDDHEVRAAVAGVVSDTLKPFEVPLKLAHMPGSGHLEVILFVGVNGSGKTTTLGKLAATLRDAGYTILIAAGDTFRAAANEQLTIWAERAEAPILEGKQGADAAGLVFDAMTRAREDGYDVLMIDTAGRLQNRTELMEELRKIVRVIRKQDPDAPHHSLLVLDATVGQNALSQVEVFKNTADVTGLVMTKLDGTAKGGVLVNLTDTHKLPVHFVGIGERLEDLEVFDAKAYAQALTGSLAQGD